MRGHKQLATSATGVRRAIMRSAKSDLGASLLSEPVNAGFSTANSADPDPRAEMDTLRTSTSNPSCCPPFPPAAERTSAKFKSPESVNALREWPGQARAAQSSNPASPRLALCSLDG